MSDIGHINSGFNTSDLDPRPVQRPARSGSRQPGREAQSPRREPDRVEISSASRSSREAGEIRADLVIRVREEIVRGVYETPEKLDAAVDAMIDAAAHRDSAMLDTSA